MAMLGFCGIGIDNHTCAFKGFQRLSVPENDQDVKILAVVPEGVVHTGFLIVRQRVRPPFIIQAVKFGRRCGPDARGV
jgi:hypothetical protein